MRRGTVFLEDEYDWLVFNCYMLSEESNGFGRTVNATVVEKYAEKFEVDFIEMLQLCRAIG
jgi:hypothetical protein